MGGGEASQGASAALPRPAGRTPRPGSLVVALAALAAVVPALVFAGLRITLPSEPAWISADAWDWNRSGVVVAPLGSDGPFQDGDRVVSIDGTALESWVRARLGGGPGASIELAGDHEFEVVRDGARQVLTVRLARQSVGSLLVTGLPLMVFVVGLAVVALLAWMRRPGEGWRRGFLLGSAANVGSALIWELGLRPSDLAGPAPMLLLFALTGFLQLVFWSSVIHVLVSWPERAGPPFRGPRFELALYVVPQAALAVVLAMSAAAADSTLSWIGSWARVLAALELILVLIVLGALVRVATRTSAGRDPGLRLVIMTCFIGALAVAGLTLLPVLLQGRPVAPRTTVALLGLPLLVLLVYGTLRSHLFEVDLLIASRRDLVVARENERRRLRRDLHDGLGPMLAAITLKLDLAREAASSDPALADRMLAEAKRDTKAAVEEVRHLTRELRPPSLDELGLVEAIRQRATELSLGSEEEGRPEIEVDVVGELPPLDAAIEAAAYGIAIEAMTNVVRHAGAAHCRVRIFANGSLVLIVEDDGTGIADDHRPGVGMASMRERAVELAGTMQVDRTRDGWTRITANLPLGS